MNKKDLKNLCCDFHKCVSENFHISSFIHKNDNKVKKLLKDGYTEQSCIEAKQDLQKIKDSYNRKL